MTTPADCTLSFSEALASDAEFVGLRASVACRGFTGHSDFTIARRDIQRFIEEADRLRADSSDSALLLGGLEKGEERLRMQIVRAGRSGQFTARVRVTATPPRSEQISRVETEFIVAPEALTVFLQGFERLISDQNSASASLSGDADAVA